MANKPENVRSLACSYLTLRRAIGILGIAFPFVLALGAWFVFEEGIQTSLSAYYHTGMQDVFVGTLWAIGVFLLSYRGYGRSDNIAGNLACLFAVGVAIFPTAPDRPATENAILLGYAHQAFAALFFLTLTYFSLFLFTKTDPNTPPSPRKRQRNKVYKACGYTMGICILLIAVCLNLPEETQQSLVEGYKLVYWLETLVVLAFGVSWFTKGQTVLRG